MLSTKQFSFNPKAKTLVADISDIRQGLSDRFPIKSHHTGRIVWFELSKTHRDDENEITHGTWISSEVDVQIIVIND